MFAILMVDRFGGYGKDGGLPWSFPLDLQFFKTMTLEKTVLMGPGTLSSLPGQKALPKRRNIILSRSTERIDTPNTELVRSFRDLVLKEDQSEIWSIGGGKFLMALLKETKSLNLIFLNILLNATTSDQALSAEVRQELSEFNLTPIALFEGPGVIKKSGNAHSSIIKESQSDLLNFLSRSKRPGQECMSSVQKEALGRASAFFASRRGPTIQEQDDLNGLMLDLPEWLVSSVQTNQVIYAKEVNKETDVKSTLKGVCLALWR
jgi:dihydrofolate reductase